MDLEPAPSHTSLGIVAGGSFVVLALATFASGYLLVLGSRAPASPPGADRENVTTSASDSNFDSATGVARAAVVRKSPKYPSAIVRDAARKNAKVVESIFPGQRVKVAQRKGKWLKISYENKQGEAKRGWTHEVNLRFL